MPHLLLAGHFGCGNLGDDAILLGFVQEIGREFDITVMSGFPEETFRNYGLRSIPRRDSGAFKEAIQSADALVFAGGSIFQDSTSVGSVKVYADLVKGAKKAGKKVYMVGQGVGPLTSMFGKSWATSAFNMTDAIVCRDAQSPQTLRTLGVKVPIQVAADCAFLLPPTESDGPGFGVGNMKAVGIAPRVVGKDLKGAAKLFGETARLLMQNQYVPVMIEMDTKHDTELLQEISRTQGGKVPEIRKLTTPMQLQGRIGRMEAVIAVRLHAGILASTMGIPPLMVSYDPKVTAFAQTLNLASAIPYEGLTANRLFENFQTFMRDRERNVKMLEKKRDELKQAAMLNVEVVRNGLLRK